jgi:hypothetical protein
MTFHIKALALSFGVLAITALALVAYHPTASALFNASKDTACQAIGASSCAGGNGAGAVNHAVATAVTILSYIAGVAAVIMVIVGGIRYITSGGDSNNISSAKNTVIYALIGLVVALLARTIVAFVFKRV